MLFTKNKRLTSTVPTPIVQLPNGFTGVWTTLYVSNSGTTENTLTIEITKKDDDDVTFLSNHAVEADGHFVLDLYTGIVLQPEDVVTVTAGASGTLDVMMTVDLTYSPLSTNRIGSLS